MKRIITLSCFLGFLVSNAVAQFNQVWNQDFQHSPTTFLSNEGKKVAEDVSGNIFVLNDVTSDLNPNGVASGGTFHYTRVNKYSPTGTLLANKQIEVFDHQVSGYNLIGGFGLEVDASGNVYIGYCPWDTGWGTNYNVKVMKCDNSLNTLWECLYVTNGNDNGVEMKVAASGEVYAIANSTNGGVTTYYLLDFASQGAPTTIHVFGASETVTSMALQPTTEEVYITGYRTSGGIKSILMAGINAVTHTLTWTHNKNVGSVMGDDFGTSVTIGADGYIYAVGSDQGGPQGNSIVVIKHTARAGKPTWIASLKHSALEVPKFIMAPEANFAYVAAVSPDVVTIYKFSTLTPPPRNLVPCIYRPAPINPIDGITGITLNGMKISANQKVYVTGGVAALDTSGVPFNAVYMAKFNVVFGTTVSFAYQAPAWGSSAECYEGVGISLDAAKSDVYWLVNFWDPAGHRTERVSLYDMDVSLPLRTAFSSGEASATRIFPNPATDRLNIQSTFEMNGAEILDLTGQVVRKVQLGSVTNTVVDLQGLSPGIYLCRIQSLNGETSLQKFVIR